MTLKVGESHEETQLSMQGQACPRGLPCHALRPGYLQP